MAQSDEPGVLATKLHADESFAYSVCAGYVNAGYVPVVPFVYGWTGRFKLAVNVLEKVANEALKLRAWMLVKLTG
jgi:3-oxoacyl-[acyl-carrier-protein] synthase-3